MIHLCNFITCRCPNIYQCDIIAYVGTHIMDDEAGTQPPSSVTNDRAKVYLSRFIYSGHLFIFGYLLISNYNNMYTTKQIELFRTMKPLADFIKHLLFDSVPTFQFLRYALMTDPSV